MKNAVYTEYIELCERHQRLTEDVQSLRSTLQGSEDKAKAGEPFNTLEVEGIINALRIRLTEYYEASARLEVIAWKQRIVFADMLFERPVVEEYNLNDGKAAEHQFIPKAEG